MDGSEPLNHPGHSNAYIVAATSALPKTRILKHENTFAIFDIMGDLYTAGNDELGIYFSGTRYLSHYTFRVGTQEPLLLNSYIRKDNGYLNVELTNPDIEAPDYPRIQKGTIYISRSKFLTEHGCHEQISFHNYTGESVSLPVCMEFNADYRDLFEIRGIHRLRRGHRLPSQISEKEIIFAYRGLDEIARYSAVEFEQAPDLLNEKKALFYVNVEPQKDALIELKITFSEQEPARRYHCFDKGLQLIQEMHRKEKAHYCDVRSSSDEFNQWVERSLDDLAAMNTMTSTGYRYPYAGIPWYCTAFGRDGIWTALLCLWANPSMAKEVLYYLSKTQAEGFIPESDAEPGKIVHEVRSGEMVNLKEVPFGKYYGSVDSTPLFVMLAGEYFERTLDHEMVHAIWPSLLKALEWIDRYGDLDGDGFVEYSTKSARGLKNQGWKDSHDSVFHADGSDPEGPIALCEVQGYVFSAKLHLANLAEVMGDRPLAVRLREQAMELRDRFDQAFWLEDLGTFALALDGKKKPCRVKASNAGHLLYTGILKPERVEPLIKTLIDPTSFSGWGIRTVATTEKRYNPVSYHNGSVWPHDTAIIGMGMAKYGYKEEVEKLFEGMLNASVSVEHQRMPEVFCGFVANEDPPAVYPVACSPQAWASATVYGLVKALLGIEINAARNCVQIFQPTLPEKLGELYLNRIQLGSGELSLAIKRHFNDVSIRLTERSGEIRMIVEK